MKNIITVCKTPIRGVQSISKSAFLIDDKELSPFSWSDLNIFKKKESSDSSSNSSSSNSTEKGSGVGLGVLSGVLGVLGGLAPLLPVIGIGSKSRIAETNATANGNTLVYNAQTQSTLASIEAEKAKSMETEKIVLIGFVAVLLIAVVVGVLFTKR